MSSKDTKIVGILNVTPDSFSDGGRFLDVSLAVKQAEKLFQEGADIIDIGGDSTRPGSLCVGSKEEWLRISEVVKEVSKRGVVSVDTHFAETAQKALEAGATMINDVSGGLDPDMFGVVASFNAQIAIMYSRCSVPHLFDLPRPANLIDAIKSFFDERIVRAHSAGLRRENLIFDPGMGGFLSSNPEDSFLILDELSAFANYSPMLIGISRKGFLNSRVSSDLEARDQFSSELGARLAKRPDRKQGLYLRVHNVQIQASAFRE